MTRDQHITTKPNKVNHLKRSFVFLLACLLMWWILVQFLATIPSADLTRTRQTVIERKLQDFSGDEVNGIEIENLPDRPGYDNSHLDGWDRPMLLQVKDGIGTVTSYGRDGKPGGKLQDTDIISSFSLTTDSI